MSTNYDELLSSWGRMYLRTNGKYVSDTATVTVDMTTEWSGGCNTCGWDETVIQVEAREGIRYLGSVNYYGGINDLLREVLEYADEARS
jgi:hypothetical protein